MGFEVFFGGVFSDRAPVGVARSFAVNNGTDA
jgi:hypothetical protein